MKWKARKPGEFKARFALLPKKIDDIWIWLEWYDTTGWHYNPDMCPYDELTRTERYPSRLHKLDSKKV